MYSFEESVVVVLSTAAEGKAVACLINIESIKPKTVESHNLQNLFSPFVFGLVCHILLYSLKSYNQNKRIVFLQRHHTQHRLIALNLAVLACLLPTSG